MAKIILNNNKGFKWQTNQRVWAKGYLYCGEKLYMDEELLNYFEVDSERMFRKRLEEANGFFSVIVEKDDLLMAGVDRLRSMPLFYKEKDFFVSDNAFKISNNPNTNINKLSMEEFICAGFVTGSETLDKSISQIKAGEYLFYSIKEGLKKAKYYSYIPPKKPKDKKNLIKEIDEIHLDVFSRLINTLGNKKVVIPLSGGQDSRLVVVMLSRLGYNNVLCYTYGNNKNNPEAVISERVSKELGFDWQFFPYRKDDFMEYLKDIDYQFFSSNLSSLPVIQEYIAVKKMKKEKIISDDSVFIPGHSYDFLVGSHIKRSLIEKKEFTKDELVDEIFSKHFNLWSKRRSRVVINKIRKNIEKEVYSKKDGINLLERFNLEERQAKFIVNSLRTYEFFGYNWRMPLWDSKLMDFWVNVELSEKIDRKLYFEYAEENKYLNKFSRLDIKKGDKGSVKKNRLSTFLPRPLYNFIRGYRSYGKDPMNFYVISRGRLGLAWQFLRGASGINSLMVKEYIKILKRIGHER